jgi:hypothetical protein
MARQLTTAMLAAVTARTVRPFFMVSLNFASGQVNLWSGVGSFTWNGMVFTGAGSLGNIDQIAETSDGSAAGIKLGLSGVPTTLIALAVEEQYQGGLAQIWLGCFDMNTSALVADPYMLFAGSMDVMTISDGTKAATITLSCENRLIELDRPRERRFSNFDQNIDFPGDTGLQYVNSLQDLQIFWGDPNGPIANYPGSGGIGPLNPG